MSPEPSRREFLFGRSSAAADDSPGPDDAVASESPYHVHVSRRAMACEFEVCLNAGQHASGTEIAIEALDLLGPLEQQMSVFRPDSEISRVNFLAAEQPVEVEPRLFEVLELALTLHRETDGAYDITSGPLWEVWGFARRVGAVPTPEQIAEARLRVGSQFVELDHRRGTVRFLRSGVRLNLGSIGKGYTVDRLAERLTVGGITDFLLHGGNSSVLARGSAGQVPNLPSAASYRLAARGWTIGVRDPLHPDRRLGEIRLENRAVGTSGTQFQFFRHKGRRYGHILDPRTGWPAEGVLSATVLAPTAALADGLSTAFYVMGPEAALTYCHSRPDIAAVLICPARGGAGWEIHQAGLSGEDWTPQ